MLRPYIQFKSAFPRLLAFALITAVIAGCANPGRPQISKKIAKMRPEEIQQIPSANIVVLDISDNRAAYPDSWNQYPDMEVLRISCESLLGKYSFFHLLSRQNLDAVLDEQRFQQSDLWSADSEKLYEVGRALGASHVLVGRFTGSELISGSTTDLSTGYVTNYRPLLRKFAIAFRLIDVTGLRTTSGYAMFDIGNSSWTEYVDVPVTRNSGNNDRNARFGNYSYTTTERYAVRTHNGSYAKNLDLQELLFEGISDLVDNYAGASQRDYGTSHISERENPSQAIKH